MKQTFHIPVVYKVKAKSQEQAEEFVDRLQRHGFTSIVEYEQPTSKGIKHWQFGMIRGRK